MQQTDGQSRSWNELMPQYAYFLLEPDAPDALLPCLACRSACKFQVAWVLAVLQCLLS